MNTPAEGTTHPLTASLRGLNLVEASAGTGKTYTIAGLYLRLVLEAQIPVENILVVTYTKAATAELRDRLRARLVQAWRVIQGTATPDEYLATLLATTTERNGLQRRLTAALASFDTAAIYTIHSFCQRVLAESAFDAGLATEVELLPNVDDLIDEIVADYWREQIYGAHPVVVWHVVVAEKLGPATLRQMVKRYAGRTDLEVRGAGAARTWEATLADFERAYVHARQTWQVTRTQVEELLLHSEVFNRNKLRVATMYRVWRDLETFFSAPVAPASLLFAEAARVTQAALALALKSGKTMPACAFFAGWDRVVELGQRLQAELTAVVVAFKHGLLEFAQQQLRERKRRTRQQSYDDLINVLYGALRGPNAGELIAKVRRQYQAALIDEFQDTDRVQYDIFARCFAETGAPVYFVGDPKQAIYSFRGADVIAYVEAAQACPSRYSLQTNWRSDAALVEGINAIFAGPAPFFIEGIAYRAVRAAHTEAGLTVDGDDGRPLRLWFAGGDEDAASTKSSVQPWVAVATANEIVRLLELGQDGRATVAGKLLDGGDIAVLVRSHHQGTLIQDALRDAGVAAVRYGQDNVFHTAEARDLERVLMAVAEPSNENLVRGALATCFFGVNGVELAGLGDNDPLWERWLEEFQRYHALWRGPGLVAMLRELLIRSDVALRILARPDGERRLTNIHHLTELLQAEIRVHHGGPAAVVKWFSGRCTTNSGDADEVLLRLESDARVVKIVTVHAAKGLEYPIVFCPFLWEGLPARRRDEQGVVYHERHGRRATVLDLGETTGQARHWAQEEEFAESLRLFYVALTRAKHRCYLVHGTMKSAVTAPLTWLLYHDRIERTPAPIAALTDYAATRDAAAVWADLQQLVERAPHAIALQEMEADIRARIAPRAPVLPAWRGARRFTGSIDSTWRVTSFSSLTAASDSEAPDRDAVRVRLETAPAREAASIFEFPRGARAGTCLHQVFETWDFRCDEARRLREHVRITLAAQGFAEQWIEPVSQMVENVLATPLDARGTVRLADVANDARVNELEFYFPLAQLDLEGLMRLLDQFGFWASAQLSPVRERFDVERIRGYLHGFIDLVFKGAGQYFIVDYKSNWLGADYEAYGGTALAPAMVEHDYYLQFLLYTVAVHRYLCRRLPGYQYDRDFGGVRYLFIRGMHPHYGCERGVYAYRPPRELLEALERHLSG